MNWAALLPCMVNDLAGILSGVGRFNSVKHQSGDILLQGDLATPPMLHLLGSPEPFDFQGGTAIHFS